MRGLSLVGTLAALASVVAWPARAEAVLLSIGFGADRIEIAADELRAFELHLNELVPRLVVLLDDAVAPRLSALTGAHVGQVGEIRVCGQPVSAPRLRAAITAPSFAISDPDAGEIRHLAAVLSARDCTPGA